MADKPSPLTDPICTRFTVDELTLLDAEANRTGENRSQCIRRIVVTAVAEAVVENLSR